MPHVAQTPPPTLAPFPKWCSLPSLGCCVWPELLLLTNPSAETVTNHSTWKWNPKPGNPPFTCFRGLTLSCCVSRSTSWGELSSCPCGWRARAATPAQPRHSPGAGTRAEASPTRSPTRGSLSSHRGWLLSCISLRKREKEMETINKLIFRGCTPVWVLWTGVNPQRCPFISAHQASQHGKLCKCRRWRCACCQCQYGVMSKTREKNRMAKVITYSHTLQGQETQPTFGWQWVSSHATIASYRSCELSELQGCFKERHSTQWQWPYYSST